MPDNNIESNKDKWSKIIGTGVGAGSFGVMGIDLRPKANIKKSPYLGATLEEVQKHIRPGDVLIGGTKTGPEALRGEIRDFKSTYLEAAKEKIKLKKGAPVVDKLDTPLAKAIKQVDTASIASKFGDPEASHATVFTSKGKTSYGGGWQQNADVDIPKNYKSLKKELSKGKTPHYTLVRPKRGVSEIPGMAKKLTQRQTELRVARRAGEATNYSQIQGVSAQIKDWITPKFNRGEKLKSAKTLASEAGCVGGVCSTTPALFSKKTVGGKAAKNVLPRDYLRSSGYDVVGRIGGGGSKSFKSRALFNAPKYLTRAGVAAGLGAAAYYGAKGVGNVLKPKDKPNS